MYAVYTLYFLCMSPNLHRMTRHGKEGLMELLNPPGSEPTLTPMLAPMPVLGEGPLVWLPAVDDDP